MKTFLETISLKKNYDLNTIDSPVIIYFKVTGCCNLNCSFCSQSEAKKINMDIHNAKKLLRELKKTGVVAINYTGGEPLVYPHIYELLEYGDSLGFEQTLVTNGINLFKNEKVLEYVNTIGISIHGMPKVHDRLCNMDGAFKIVENNINKILKQYPHTNININYTLTKDNIDEENMTFIKDFAKKKNLKLCFGRLNYLGYAKNEEIIEPNKYLKIIESLKEDYKNISISNCISACSCSDKYRYLCHSCGAGVTIFSVDANGDVKICSSSNYILGNAFTGSFKKIINSSIMKRYRLLQWLPNVCRICKDFEYCKGGCHAEGNFKFYENSCDALLVNKLNIVWEYIKDKKLILKNGKFRKEKDKYLIIKVPLRKVDSNGFKVLTMCSGKFTGSELQNEFKKIENIRDFLCTLYLDGVIEVKYEKKND